MTKEEAVKAATQSLAEDSDMKRLADLRDRLTKTVIEAICDFTREQPEDRLLSWSEVLFLWFLTTCQVEKAYKARWGRSHVEAHSFICHVLYARADQLNLEAWVKKELDGIKPPR